MSGCNLVMSLPDMVQICALSGDSLCTDIFSGHHGDMSPARTIPLPFHVHGVDHSPYTTTTTRQ